MIFLDFRGCWEAGGSVLRVLHASGMRARTVIRDGVDDTVQRALRLFHYVIQGVSKFDVINLGGVRAWQDKFIEMGNLGPATPNKGARRPRSLRL